MVGSGVLWTLTYLLIIRQGFLHHTYGMPLAGLCANIAWEFIFAFVYPHDLPQRAVNVVWLSFDVSDGAYSAFGQNLMMSILFLTMLYSRGTMRGQSVWIAVLKMGGTALASFSFYLFNPDYDGSILLPFLYVAIFIFDGIYVGATTAFARRERKPHYPG